MEDEEEEEMVGSEVGDGDGFDEAAGGCVAGLSSEIDLEDGDESRSGGGPRPGPEEEPGWQEEQRLPSPTAWCNAHRRHARQKDCE